MGLADNKRDKEQVEADHEAQDEFKPLLDPKPKIGVKLRIPIEEEPLSSRKLLFYRCIYFLNGLSGATWGRFAVVFYNEIKQMSPQQIGFLQGVTPLLSFVTMPIWGYLSDWLQSKKRIYLLTKVFSTISLLSLALPQVTGFQQVAVCVVFMAMFRSSGVLDAHVLDFLGDKHRGMYGSIRIWNSLSWGLGCVAMGILTDTVGFEANFILYGAMMTTMILVTAWGFPAKTKAEEARYEEMQRKSLESANPASSRPQLALLFKALCHVNVIFWLVQVAVIGAGMALVDSFLFVFLQNNLSATTSLCGYTVGVTVLFCLPIFHWSQFLLQRVGHDLLFIIAMVAYSTRVIGYSMLTPSTVHWVLALEVLHGFTFASVWIASVDFSAAVAPKEWSTTVQAILSSSLFCVGGGIGPIVGGWVVEVYGSVIMFRYAGLIMGIIMGIHLILFMICGEGPHGGYLRRVEKKESPSSSTNEETNQKGGA